MPNIQLWSVSAEAERISGRMNSLGLDEDLHKQTAVANINKLFKSSWVGELCEDQRWSARMEQVGDWKCWMGLSKIRIKEVLGVLG